MPPEESTAAQSTPGTEFYTWTFPGAPIRIHLHLNVVERLSREVRRAFESVPSHSVEIGGFLLGAADFFASPIIEIKDFEPFLSEYRSDHKFILSEPDRRKLEKLLGADRPVRPDGLTVVGYYRSHIGEGLGLRPEDLAWPVELCAAQIGAQREQTAAAPGDDGTDSERGQASEHPRARHACPAHQHPLTTF